jgi:signal transduction histidine kinase
MSVPHVLIVDDDLALLQALPEALHLRIKELTVDTCDSASAALDRIATIDYDAIVTDIKMPGVDGLALLAEIRALRPHTPALLITGHGEHDLAVRALRGGAYDFIQKPIERDYFVAALTRAIQVRQLRRRLEEQQTELERHAIELERTVEARTHELREANRIKDEFLAVMSHELRTPLNSILGWAHLVRTGALDQPTSQRALHTIERNTRLLGKMIEDLLDVSRIMTGKLLLDVRPIELGQVIEAALEAVRPASDAKNIHLEALVDPSVGAVSGDPNRLQQVVWNLLSNAIKFTPNHGHVEVRLARVGSTACITVSDSGEGIGEEFLPFVFDRFRQADSTFSRQHGGLGIGLAIVRHLVEMHGGSVSADSQGKGKGSTFTVSFPLLASGRDGSLHHESKMDERQPVMEQRLDLAGLSVMIVDDERDARDVLVAILEFRGAKVIAASSAAEAIEVLMHAKNGSRPDVLVSDIGMPSEDGFDLIGKVRALGPEQGGEIPAIALTAYAREEDRERVLEAGFQRHVAKPVEPTALAQAVASLASRTVKAQQG